MDDTGGAGTVILALDTTTRPGSVAVCRRGRIEPVYVGDVRRSHGERLPGDIETTLARAGLRVADVDLFAVITGPGSFTGLRVGIAAIQGLAMATGRKVIGVPALEAYASSALVPDGTVGVWMDAQRQQVFAAVYEKRGGQLAVVRPPVSWTPAAVIKDWSGGRGVAQTLVGDGIDLYKDAVEAAWPGARLIVPAPPLAPIAATIAALRPHAAVPPHALVPVYVRASDAEIARRDRPAGTSTP